MEVVEERTEAGAAEFLDRRQHKRYAVDAMAEVVVADGAMLFRGRVLDISLAGCYVETQARLRLETGTKVEMVFNVNGVTFRPSATAKVVRSGSGAGFRFLDLNARMQPELEALIAALAARRAPSQGWRPD
jgi:c-di-GMP-binding flagellar brake protein YcgR